MRRWPLVISFVLFIALCASLAYWAMYFLKPPARPVAAPPPSVQPPPDLQVAASLFGGKSRAAVASNFQLRGVLVSGTPGDSVAILSTDGKPAQAVGANMEILPGVKVKEVHRRYVVLLDQGVEKRVELPEESTTQVSMEAAKASPVPATRLTPPRSAPAMPPAMVNNPATAQTPPAAAGNNVSQPASPATAAGASAQPNAGMPATAAPSSPAVPGGAASQAANPVPQNNIAPNTGNNAENPTANVPAPGMPVQAPTFPQPPRQ